MLVRTDDGKGFILNTYFNELINIEISRKRRYYFKHDVLTVKRHPDVKSLFVLRYKGTYVTSWTDRDDGAEVHDRIAAVCRTLDIALGVIGL